MMIKAKTVINLYHGTAVDWLMTDGFYYQEIPFGEANPPHEFLYVCSLYRGAESSALNSKAWCQDRIIKDASFEKNFARNSNKLPEAVVYTVDIGGLKSIDWKTSELERKQASMLFSGLRKIHRRKCQMLEYYARRFGMLKSRTRGWQNWVLFAGTAYLSGPADDRRSIIFRESGFQVVRNFEEMPDSKYGEVAALIYGDEPYIPTSRVFV